MFNKLKELVSGKKPKTQLELVPRDELKDRPFTLALLLRAATETDESKADLDNMTGRKTPAIPELNTLDEKIRSAATVVAMSIMNSAADQAGCKITVVLPGERLTVKAQMALAFGFVIIVGMINPLKHEGFTLDFRETCISLVSSMLMFWKPEQIVEGYNAVSEIFKGVARGAAEHANAKEWFDNNTRLVLMYVEQFTTTNQKLKDTELLPLFASQLKSLLSTHEPPLS